MAAFSEGVPGLAKRGLALHGISSRRMAALLLPGGDAVEDEGDDRTGLDHLNEPQRTEVSQRRTKGDGADDHPKQQHDIHEADDLRLRFRRRQIGGQRQAYGLNRMKARTYKQKGDARANVSDPDRVARGLAPA